MPEKASPTRQSAVVPICFAVRCQYLNGAARYACADSLPLAVRIFADAEKFSAPPRPLQMATARWRADRPVDFLQIGNDDGQIGDANRASLN